ncbi:hypothetical protein MJ588_19860 [Klebsiella pneumoniae]|nr:hypothetical protein MJ588_19860 [Klebsiella pneumoniae]
MPTATSLHCRSARCNECLNARLDSLAAIIEKFCEPQVAIVSLTITEKGYCIDPATGKLDPTHPRIIHDLENPTPPQSAPGILVEAPAPPPGNEAPSRPLPCSPVIISPTTVTW